MRTQRDRDEDLAIGRELECKDAEITTLKGQVAGDKVRINAARNQIAGLAARAEAAERRSKLLWGALRVAQAWMPIDKPESPRDGLAKAHEVVRVALEQGTDREKA